MKIRPAGSVNFRKGVRDPGISTMTIYRVVNGHAHVRTEYYITNRPIMKKCTPIHTAVDVRLIVRGSVRNLQTQPI